MNKPNRKGDLRDDTPAKPNAGAGTQKDVKDSSDPCDTRRLGNRPPTSKVENAEVQPDSRAQAAKRKQLGEHFRHTTN